MGLITFLLRWVSYLILFVFATVCLATGLYYLAELVEEYEKLTRKLLKYAIWGILGFHVLVWIMEGYPFLNVLVGVGAHLIYLKLLQQFPRIHLSNPILILGGISLVVDHLLWFRFFTSDWHPFEDVVTFFLLCVWLVPFCFFISLTSAESSLPSYGATMSASGEPVDSDGLGKPKSANLLVGCFRWLKRKQEELVPMGRVLGDHHPGYKTF